ncbi:MAG: glycerophosphodiester phosphodiesterase [Oceanococcaceae bacterium]
MHSRDDRTWSPTVIAHRGISAHYPENTAPAFAAAEEAGIAGIELDLQISRDGVVVIYHDHKMAKLGLSTQHLREYDWSRLARCDAGRWKGEAFAGTPLLRLDEVLQRWGGKLQLLLEIKAHGRGRRGSRDMELAEAAMELLLAAPAAVRERSAILCFSQAVLDRVGAICADAGQPPPQRVRNLVHPGELRATRGAELESCSAICVDINRFGVADVLRIRRAGKPLYAYTVDTRQQVLHAHALGCSLLICNDPVRVRGLIQELALSA